MGHNSATLVNGMCDEIVGMLKRDKWNDWAYNVASRAFQSQDGISMQRRKGMCYSKMSQVGTIHVRFSSTSHGGQIASCLPPIDCDGDGVLMYSSERGCMTLRVA
jgi:hypothetical protein